MGCKKGWVPTSASRLAATFSCTQEERTWWERGWWCPGNLFDAYPSFHCSHCYSPSLLLSLPRVFILVANFTGKININLHKHSLSLSLSLSTYLNSEKSKHWGGNQTSYWCQAHWLVYIGINHSLRHDKTAVPTEHWRAQTPVKQLIFPYIVTYTCSIVCISSGNTRFKGLIICSLVYYNFLKISILFIKQVPFYVF